MATIALDHARQQSPCNLHQAGAVGIDHGLPVCQVRTLRRLQPERQAGVVDEHVDGGELGWQHGDYGLDRCAVTHVKFDWQEGRAEFFAKGQKTIMSARGGNDAVASFDECPSNGDTKSGRCSSKKYDHVLILVVGDTQFDVPILQTQTTLAA
jgi:hypothetical protein